MAKLGKSEQERRMEKFIELSEKYLSLANETNKSFKEREKIKLQLSRLDAEFAKEAHQNAESINEYLNKYKTLLELEKELRAEKEKELKIDAQRQKLLEKEKNKYDKLKSGYDDYYKFYFNNDKRNFSDTLKTLGNIKYHNSTNMESEIRDKVTQRVVKEYTAQGKTDPKYYNEMVTTINKRVDNDLEHAGIAKSSKSLQKSAEYLNSAGELLISGITSITKLFTQGMSRQVKIYEDTFSGIAARTGMSRSGYFNAQLNTMSDLSSRNMLDNVGVSEVQEMWNKLAQTGMNETSILINGIENVITQKVVPYLDTSTLSFNLLNSRLNNQFVKDIRGITLANQELANNNYLTQDLLQKIIDEVQPMSDKAIEDLALNSTESIAMLNKLMLPKSEGGAGLSENQAKEYLTNAFQLQKYRSQMMRNGSTYEKYLATEAQRLGINDTAGLINLGVGTSTMIGSIMPNYDTNPLEASIFSEGIYGANSYDLAMAGQKLQGVYSSNFFSDILNMTPEQLQKYNDEATRKLSNGEYNTATDMQEYLTENIATPVATIAEQVGTFGRDIFSTLTSIHLAIIGTGLSNTITSALGIKGVAGGFSSILSGAGIVLAGASIMQLGQAIGTTIGKSMNDEQNDKLNNERAELEQKAASAGLSDAAQNLYGSMGNNYASNGNLEVKYGGDDMYSKMFWQSANPFNAFKNDSELTMKNLKSVTASAFKNKDKTAYNKAELGVLLAHGLNQSEFNKVIMAYLIGLNSQGYEGDNSVVLESIKSAQGITSNPTDDLLAEYLMATKYKYSDYKEGISLINKYGANLWTKSGKWFSPKDKDYNNLFNKLYKKGEYDTEQLDYLMSHRQGLAKVPYDGYQAVLHAGETIMTASTTATMESMVQAFRESQNQNYRIDAAIQEQTAQLVSKIDEVINAMGTISFGSVNNNSPSERLRNSLRTLTSPLAFQG